MCVCVCVSVCVYVCVCVSVIACHKDSQDKPASDVKTGLHQQLVYHLLSQSVHSKYYNRWCWFARDQSKWISKMSLISQSVRQSVRQTVSHSVSEIVSQSASQWDSQLVISLVSWSFIFWSLDASVSVGYGKFSAVEGSVLLMRCPDGLIDSIVLKMAGDRVK